ncbi:helix-turn-helix domain-containing protein [Nocardia terpenica]|uniref:HTH cro/C1-type domain-containing protein n=1 Tax=Nocardia terpenica TaxID=455432 RepID=A0A164JWD6_9NOCA|nr:helix-turn-helix transcriptional regulator [Nocardia terpenica]KZM70787.1 hypothetical protein AWN90_40230 [Nocardia terpenica]NQE89945.1 helix-turn-helix transcriptional regulator [Nocardia terpenica]
MAELNAAVAYVIKRLRLEAGLTAEDVYLATGLSRNAYNRLEWDERTCNIEQLHAIASIYGLRASDLLHEAEDLVKQGAVPELPPNITALRKALGLGT